MRRRLECMPRNLVQEFHLRQKLVGRGWEDTFKFPGGELLVIGLFLTPIVLTKCWSLGFPELKLSTYFIVSLHPIHSRASNIHSADPDLGSINLATRLLGDTFSFWAGISNAETYYLMYRLNGGRCCAYSPPTRELFLPALWINPIDLHQRV